MYNVGDSGEGSSGEAAPGGDCRLEVGVDFQLTLSETAYRILVSAWTGKEGWLAEQIWNLPFSVKPLNTHTSVFKDYMS